VQVALSVSHGVLTLGGTTGLTITDGASGSASLTFTGAVANINSDLDGLTYLPAAAYTGPDTLQIVTNDLGNTAAGGQQTATSSVAITVAAAPLLNEIEANPPGTSDNRYEYVELRGMAGASLNNVYLVVFDGISTNTPGTADLVVNLSPYSLGSDGLLVVKSVGGTGHAIPSATTLVPDSFFTQSGGFNDGTLSFYLFFSTSPFVSGADYDANNDGVLDDLPSGSQVLDDVALLDTNKDASDDKAYGSAVVTEFNSTGTPDAVTRFTGNTTPSSPAAWYGGELVDTGNVASQINYDVTRESANEPPGMYLTPGDVNVPSIGETFLTVSPATGSYRGNTTLSAALTSGGLALADDIVTFSLNGSTVGTATTNAGGIATLSGISLTGFDAGTYTACVGASFSGDANDSASSGTANLTVNTAPLTVSGITAADKVYDGTAAATLNTGSAVLVGLFSGDTVNLNAGGASGAFSSKNVGSGITVTVSGLVITGAQSSNYTLTPPTTTANITPATLSVSGVTANSKVYDGTTAATLNTAGAALQGVFSGDAVTLHTAGAVGTFSGRNVANGLRVNVSGLTIGGAQKGDYSLKQPTATANITARPITVTAAADTKTYDGTTSTTSTPTITSGSLATGDTAAFTETFAAKNAGTGKTLTPAGSVNDGNGGNDYAVTFATNTTGQIMAAALTVTANNQSRAYGAANPSLTCTLAGFVNGDTSASLTTLPLVSTTATTASYVGSYPIQAAGAVDPNYTISYVSGALTVTSVPVAISVVPLVTNSRPTFNLTGTAVAPSPNSGIASVSVLVNGQTTAATVSGNTWSATLSTLSAGTYNVQVTAADNAGNSSTVAATGVLVVNAGTTLNLSGTSFSFIGGLTPAKWTILVNGSHVTNIPATTTAVVFTGTGSSATASITGASTTGESASIAPGQATFDGVGSGGPYTVAAANLLSATVTSGGSGSLSVTDAAGGNVLTELPGQTTLTSSSNSSRTMVAKGFNNVVAAAAGAGSSTTASLFGSSAADTFTANPQSAVMQDAAKTAYRLEAGGFATVRGIGGTGDTALLTDAAGGALNATAAMATLSGAGYNITASSFASVQATAVGPGDAANLQAGPGTNVFTGGKGKSEFKGVNFDDVASGFFTINAYGAATGYNTGVLTDSAGNATATLNPQTATLTDASARGPASYQINLVSHFQVIDAFETSLVGSNKAVLKGSSASANFFTSTSTTAALVPSAGNAYREYAQGFTTVQAASTYANDTASLYDSPGNDAFTATPTSATMSLATGKTVVASGFKTVNAYSRYGGTDTASLTDTNAAGADAAWLWSTNALMKMSTGNTVRAWYFAKYNLQGNGGSGDTVTTMDASVLPTKQTNVSSATVIAWLADFAGMNQDYSPGSQNTSKSYAIAVDQVLTAYWS
jgi:hypothetical protein